MMKEFEPVRLGDGAIDYGDGIIGPSAADCEFAARQIVDEEVCITQVATPVPEVIAPFRLVGKLPKFWRRPLLTFGCAPVLAAVAAGCGGNGEETPDQTDRDGPTEPGVEEPTPPRHFLELPFRPNIGTQIQQGWYYTGGREHKGLDYIAGELDRSATWESFEVLAAADGKACANPPARLGEAVFVKHILPDDSIYYT